jgi:hypothetical protein
MAKMEHSSRHRSATVPISSLRQLSSVRILLVGLVVAAVALSVGALLLDGTPDVDSVVFREEPATDSSVETSGSSINNPGQMNAAGDPAGTGNSGNVSPDDPQSDTIQRGEDLIAETHAQLAANPLASGSSPESKAAFDSRIEAVREEIDQIRKELHSTQQ